MGSACDNIRMECVGKDVAWDLFKYCARAETIDAHPEIKSIAMKMVAECRGIPKALCTIRSIMSTRKDVRQWRVAYEMLMLKPSQGNEIDGYPCLDYFFASSCLKDRD